MSITIHNAAAFVLPMAVPAALAAFGAVVARAFAAPARTAALTPVNGWAGTSRVDGTYDPQSRGSSG